MSRKRAREESMKLMYEMEIKDRFSQEVLDIFLGNDEYKKDEISYINESNKEIIGSLKTIDDYISKHSHGWSIDRLSKVDLSILRIGVYELLYRDDIPKEVSINEAIEMSKKYSTKDSYKFINGVLGGIVKDLEGEN